MLNFVWERIIKGIPKNKRYISLMKSMLMLGFFLPFVPMILVVGIIVYQFDAAYKDHLQIRLIDAARTRERTMHHYLNDRLGELRFITGFFDYEKLQDPAVLKSILEKLRAHQNPFFESLGFLDNMGREIGSTRSEEPSHTSYAKSGWFKKVLKSGYVISEITIENQSVPQIVIAVRGGTHEAPWVLRSSINNAAFNGRVQELRKGNTGSVFMFNKNGYSLTRPTFRNKPMKGQLMDFLGVTDKEDDIAVVRRRDEKGRDNFYVSTFLKPVGWILVYKQEASELLSALNRAKKVTGGIVLLAGVCIALYSLSLSRKTVRRIEEADKKQQKMNEQMLQTSKLASIGELAAGIAHEINNPVAIMVEEAGWIEDLLGEENLQELKNLEEFERALKQIHSQGQRCKEITHKLLSFARKTDFKIQKVNLNELINDITSLSSRHSKYNRVMIKLEIQKNLPEFMLPPTELQQVLLNLIHNAIDAVEEDDGCVLVTADVKEQNITIEVSDNGPGISEEDLPRIFDPFFTTKPVGKGTGLGLSICYGIVKRMGGEINVNSFPGSGTIFRINIPAVKAEEASLKHSV